MDDPRELTTFWSVFIPVALVAALGLLFIAVARWLG
jgi:hypothetical protein